MTDETFDGTIQAAATKEVAVSGPLLPDQRDISIFLSEIFKHADAAGLLALRMFSSDRNSSVTILGTVPIGDAGLHEKVYAAAHKAATETAPYTFSPPVSTFKDGDNAKTGNLHEGVTLSVDCDSSPRAALIILNAILGKPTLVVESGGFTSEGEPKLHIYYRLKIPTKIRYEHDLLKEARKLAAELVGGDRTGAALVHPMRMAGSVHRKGVPRLATIVERAETEIDLLQAYKALCAAYEVELASRAERGLPALRPRMDVLHGESKQSVVATAKIPHLADGAEMSQWANGALMSALENVIGARVGSRGSVLNTEAFNLGQIIAGGHLNANFVRESLISAAKRNGSYDFDGAHLTEANVERAIFDGAMTGPRDPKPRHGESVMALAKKLIVAGIKVGTGAVEDLLASEPEVPLSYESVKSDIAEFRTATVARNGINERVQPEELAPIIDKIALLGFRQQLSIPQSATLEQLLLGAGVQGFSDKGLGKGAKILRDMIGQACARLMNENKAARWQGSLMMNDSGTALANEENAAIAVGNMYGGQIRYDRFKDVICFNGTDGRPAVMGKDEHFDVLISVQREAIGSIRPPQVRAAVERIARGEQFDSLQDYLRGLKWDGVSRLGWMHQLLGAKDTDLNRQIETWWAIGAVARALRPGCKMDNMLVLGSGQGKGKNKALTMLSGGRSLEFADDFGTKDGQQKMRGNWMIEMAELSSLSKRDHKAFKAFQTRTEDDYRKAFDVDFVKYPRQFVNVGTTNHEPFLRDPTGERRFWIVDLGEGTSGIRHEALARNTHQIWAEAVVRFDANEKWWPEGAADQWFLDTQVRVNEKWSLIDPWELHLRSVLVEGRLHYADSVEGSAGVGLPYAKSRGAEWILEALLDRPRGQFTGSDAARVTAIMKRLGYKGQTVKLGGKATQGYSFKGDGTAGKWWLNEEE